MVTNLDIKVITRDWIYSKTGVIIREYLRFKGINNSNGLQMVYTNLLQGDDPAEIFIDGEYIGNTFDHLYEYFKEKEF